MLFLRTSRKITGNLLEFSGGCNLGILYSSPLFAAACDASHELDVLRDVHLELGDPLMYIYIYIYTYTYKHIVMYNNIYIHKYNIYIYMFLCTKYIYIYREREIKREI